MTSTKIFTLKELSYTLHDIESTKDKMLGAATNKHGVWKLTKAQERFLALGWEGIKHSGNSWHIFSFFLLKQTLFFRAAFVSSKTEPKVQSSQPPLSPCGHSLPTNSFPHQHGVICYNKESTVTHYHHSRLAVPLRGHSWCCTFHGFGQMGNDTHLPLQCHAV